MSRTGVVLFTRDLRAHDHPALEAARRECDRVVHLFVTDRRLERCAARTAFLHARLDELRRDLGELHVVAGDYVEEAMRFEPDAVYLSEDVTAYAQRRVRRLSEACDVRPHPGITIVPPGEIAPAGRDHYRVFSAYWRAWRAVPLPAGPVMSRLPHPLSPYLHVGAVSPAAVARGADEDLLRKLCWRDFFAQLHAVTGGADLRERTWRDDPAAVAAWKAGRTGYPYVDAAMRQLAAEGWIDNRARMVVASFLTKLLGMDWRVGAAHFMRHLVDGDVPSNTGNWQWVAGTGADTRPNRWFNPEAQAKRFDPDGSYVRRWLPELGTDDYPAPIVDYDEAVARLSAARSPA